MRIVLIFACLVTLLWPLSVHAYVGPGLGLGAIGVILGIFVSIFLAIVGIFWYPIKRFIRAFRTKANKNDD